MAGNRLATDTQPQRSSIQTGITALEKPKTLLDNQEGRKTRSQLEPLHAEVARLERELVTLQPKKKKEQEDKKPLQTAIYKTIASKNQ